MLLRFDRILIFAVILSVLTGCTSHQFGTKMDSTTVGRLEKGKSTRAEVEATLGPAQNVFVLPDGRRLMTYTFSETNVHAKPESYIPYLGFFIGGARGTSQQQTLQIYVSSQNIVEDYEFSDRTNAIDSTRGVLTPKVTNTPLSQAR